MQRITITFDDELLSDLDKLMAQEGYQNRSEIIRDIARTAIRQGTSASKEGSDCIAALVYVYEQSTRELPKRLAKFYHDHRDLAVSTMRAHLNAEDCFEMTLLRGDACQIRDFARHVIAERGVEHGQLFEIPLSSPPPKRESSHGVDKA
jgi:CopG family nickel-responsive transcriptional regulator